MSITALAPSFLALSCSLISADSAFQRQASSADLLNALVLALDVSSPNFLITLGVGAPARKNRTEPSSLALASGISSTDSSVTVTAVLRAKAGAAATAASRVAAISFFMDVLSGWMETDGNASVRR